MQQQLTRTARNATAIALSTFLIRGIQAAWLIFLARLLGEAAYGTWGAIGAMIAIAASVAEFGIGLIVLRDVAQKPTEAGRYLAATLVTQTALSAVAYLILVAVGFILPNDAETRLLIVIAGLSLIVDSLGNMCFNQLLAMEQMITTSAITVIHILILIAFAFTAVFRGGGLPGLYLATILAGLYRVALFWVGMRRLKIRPVWPLDGALARHLLREGLPLALTAFFAIAYQYVDKILAYTFLTKADTGYLTAAFIIVYGVVDLTSTTVLIALFPLMSRMAQANPGELRALTSRLVILLLAITLPIAVGISGLAAKLAALLFPGFSGAAGVLQILIWHVVVLILGAVYGQWMIVERRQRRRLVIQVWGLGINIVLNVLMLPRLGVQGAGVAIFIAQTVILVLYMVEFRPDRPALERLGNYAARIGLAGAAMALTIYALRESNLFLAGFAGVAVYAVGIIVLRALAPDHWAILRGAAVALPMIGPMLNRRLPVPAAPAP